MLAIILSLIPTILQDVPEAIALWRQYEPELAKLVSTFGPEIEGAILPLIKTSAAKGTLVTDVEGIINQVKTVAPLLGTLTSLGDIGSVIGSLQQVDAGNPTPEMDRSARPTKTGGK